MRIWSKILGLLCKQLAHSGDSAKNQLRGNRRSLLSTTPPCWQLQNPCVNADLSVYNTERVCNHASSCPTPHLRSSRIRQNQLSLAGLTPKKENRLSGATTHPATTLIYPRLLVFSRQKNIESCDSSCIGKCSRQTLY